MPDATSYLVQGFGKGFDMRPMNFQSAVPEFWVCSFCRVISSTVVVLPCMHSVCESCFASCLVEDKLCPVDQVPVEEDDVHRVPFSEKKLLMLRVSCWNAPKGCTFSGSCVDVLSHFESGCEFHVISCTSCEARVLRKDVVKHLKSACRAHIIQCADSERPTSSSQSDHREGLETKQLLEKIRDDHLHLQTSFNELSEGVETASARQLASSEAGVTRVVDLVGEINTALRSALQESVTNCESRVSREVSVLRESLPQATQKIRRLIIQLSSAPKKVNFQLVGWRNIITRLYMNAAVENESPLLNICGYSVRPFVKMPNTSRSNFLEIHCRIHPGPMDDVLEWPLKGKLILRVVHQGDATKTKTTRVDITQFSPTGCFQRPVSGPNESFFVLLLSNRDLEHGGFIDNDTLHLSIEMR